MASELSEQGLWERRIPLPIAHLHLFLGLACDLGWRWYDLSPERAQNRATDLGFSRYSADWQDVVNDPAIDLISVCTPNDTHAEISIAALKAGKHVWCEKPMSTTLSDSVAMRDMAAASTGKTIIGYNYTKNPAVTHARRLIEEGHIGRVSGFSVGMM